MEKVSYAMQTKVEDKTKEVSLKTRASTIILNDGASLDAKIEEICSCIDAIVERIIDDKINTASEQIYNRIMDSINNSTENNS